MVVRGTYCICICVEEDVDVIIGSLGLITFLRGMYIYVGSGLNSLIPRIVRHIKTSRGTHNVIRWHIDYLLRNPHVSISDVYVLEKTERLECVISEEVSHQGEAVKGFGCSDCRCTSHLYRVDGFEFLEKMGMRRFPIGSSLLPGSEG